MADQITRASDKPQIVTKTIITPKGEVINIETDVTERSKLKMDSRKWILARLAPRKYGDKVTQELVGPGGGAIKSETTIVDDIQARLDALRERMRALALPEKKERVMGPIEALV